MLATEDSYKHTVEIRIFYVLRPVYKPLFVQRDTKIVCKTRDKVSYHL